MHRVLFSILWTGTAMFAADYQVGLASVVITPTEPTYMSGYAARSHASEGVLTDLKAKAMVIRHQGGTQAAIVTMDLIGIPRSISDVVAARVEKQYGIERARLVLNCSHTHTGPLVGPNLENLFQLSPQDKQVVENYGRALVEKLVTLVGAAIQNLAPADVKFGNGQVHFGKNRREITPAGVRNSFNPNGPTDPDVPVLKVTSPDGKLRAAMFGYACHNTTLTAETYQFSGDYAGFAQAEFETAHPGSTAMFMELCGADQNPLPRGKVEHAQQYGKELAAEAGRVISGGLTRVSGPVQAAFQITDLRFAPHTRATFEAQLQDKSPFKVRNAKNMLKAYDENRPIRTYPYPVQAIAFGKELTLVALGGEVVVDYCLRMKKEYGAKGIIVAGYSNDVMSYIPSLRVLKEGGYEPDDSMIYYGLPGPYSDDV